MIMMKIKQIAVVTLLSLNLSNAYAELPDIEEGLWEVSTESSVVGMPMEIPTMTVEECFTKESMNPEKLMQQSGCQMNNLDIQATQASWDVSCQQEGMTMQGNGSLKFQKKSFSGVFNLRMSGSPSGDMNMKTKLTGRYLGVCNK